MRQGLFDDNLMSEFNEAKNNLQIPVNKIKLSFNEDEDLSTDLDKILKSSKINILQRLSIITRNVYRILGKYRKSVQVIKTKEDLHNYISNAVKKGRIAVDTETNNSLDPVTCKLAGLCLYYPGAKQAYIPVNHRDPITKERLSWQLTEADIAEELQRLIDNNTYIIMHNGKFDYEVIKCTCGIALPIDWDTMIGQRLTDENDQAGLKYLYTKYLNPAQSKYSIDKLFVNVQYLDVDPDVFALYAATDSFETDEVFLWEAKKFFNITNELDEQGKPDPATLKEDMHKLYNLFSNVEMPIVRITGDMELTGVCVDQALGDRLKDKYTVKLEKLDAEIENKLNDLSDLISDWRQSPEANAYPRQYQPKKSKKSRAELEEEFPYTDAKTGKRYKISKKCLKDQLDNPIKLSSSQQMAILFYDILDIPSFDKKSARTTGEDAIEHFKEVLEEKALLADTWMNPDIQPTAADYARMAENAKPYYSAAELCDLLLKRRGIVKLITTYIETIPTLVKHWPDGRIRFHLNSLGTDTGRYSSGGKLKFMETTTQVIYEREVEHVTEPNSDYFIVSLGEEVETVTGWVSVTELQVGDLLDCDTIIVDITKSSSNYILFVKSNTNLSQLG